ncbi:MAG: 50S ribosomal protein L11 methyltransferase [Planktomarina sp.]
MPTYTALTTLKGKAPAEALGDALENLDPAPTGVGVFEMEDGSGLWEVGAYFIDAPDDVALALLAAVHGAKDFAVSEVPDVDWVAKVKRELSPVVAGRFFVYGSHDADKVPDGSIALLIEAAMAFGTGHHGTTLGCLKAFDRLLDQGKTFENVLDLGCGTAVLAMAAARVFPQTVLASDIDPVAVDVAAANVVANDLEGRVKCVEAAGFEADALKSNAPFDLIFANILKGPLIDLAPDMAGAVAPGGMIILSGLLTDQAEEVIGVYETAEFALNHREDLGEWSALTLQRQ